VLELGTLVGMDGLDAERELLQDVVDETDRGLLVRPVVDPERILAQSSIAMTWQFLPTPGSGAIAESVVLGR
jgi:hypothetical protein